LPLLIWFFIAGYLKMAVNVRGGVMSTNGSTQTATAVELDMRNLLRAKKTRLSNESKETGDDFSFLVSQISSQSVHEIDHLIEGLRGVREKLDKDSDRLQLEIEQYTAFGQSIIQLAKIVSDGMTIVNKAPTTVPEL
jgi:hypothetical protein